MEKKTEKNLDKNPNLNFTGKYTNKDNMLKVFYLIPHGVIESIAKVCHAANKAWIEQFGLKQEDWDNLDEFQKERTFTIVKDRVVGKYGSPKCISDSLVDFLAFDAIKTSKYVIKKIKLIKDQTFCLYCNIIIPESKIIKHFGIDEWGAKCCKKHLNNKVIKPFNKNNADYVVIITKPLIQKYKMLYGAKTRKPEYGTARMVRIG